MPWHKVSRVGDPEPGKVKYIEAGPEVLALCNVDGEYHAIEDVCTHDGGPLDQGELDGAEIECPRHGGRFDVCTGRATCFPAVMPVKTFPVKVEGDDILVEV
jgi:3-phenylpropionate/trans-cinnamate dioxygenase ferredoxin component